MNEQMDSRLSVGAKQKVRGKLPTKREVVDWSQEKLHQFLRFVDFFTENEKFNTTNEKIETAWMRGADEPYWDEFMERVTNGMNSGMTTKQFRLRLTALARVPLSWMKSNPHALTPEMLKIMEANPRLAWAAKAFKLVTTDLGAQIVLRDNDERTDPGIKNVQPGSSDVATPLVKYEQARLTALSLLLELGKSIPRSELKNMPVKDRIVAFDKVFNTVGKFMGQGRPNSVIFQQINVNKANREDLEKTMLQYAEGQE